MPTICKITINDDAALRDRLDCVFESASKTQVAQWALELASHILKSAVPDYLHNSTVLEGYKVNREWQEGNARMHDVRQAGFKIHKLAKECDNVVLQAALRVVGQAVSTGHMQEHGMVASDYAVKYINLVSENDPSATKRERLWQIDKLKAICRI